MLVAVLPLVMLAIAVRTKWKSVVPEIELYWLCGWAIWLSEFHRRDIYHLAFGSVLLIVVVTHALTESRTRLADAALQILAVTAVLLAGFNCCVVLFMGSHPAATRVGEASVVGKGADLRLLNKYVLPGEEVLVYPYCPTCYFLSGTINPTRYSLLLYNYNTYAQFQEVIDTLEYRRVKYVVWDSRLDSKSADILPGAMPKNPNDLIIEPFLESHYVRLEEDNGVRLMEREP